VHSPLKDVLVPLVSVIALPFCSNRRIYACATVRSQHTPPIFFEPFIQSTPPTMTEQEIKDKIKKMANIIAQLAAHLAKGNQVTEEQEKKLHELFD
jgi:hypothetical protein